MHVAALRKALGDRAVIQTVPRAGYRFTAAVKRISVPAEGLSMRWPIGVLPAHPAVFELIGRGRSCLLTASRSETPKAVAAFREAIELDPTYAAAHAGLALACCAQAELRLIPVSEAYSEARAAALRALAMDDSSADAQVALATVLFLSDWNWTGAKRSLERALELDPDHTDGWLLYGRLMEALGDLEQGLAAKQKALERQPSSAAVHLQIAMSYWNQRRYEQVIEWANRSLALDPAHPLAREFVAAAYLKKGDLDRHMAESIAHAASHRVSAEALDELKRSLCARRSCRRAWTTRSVRPAASTPAVQLALLHGELGNMDEAFAHLDAAIERRDPSLVHLAVAPQWDCLRDDPRFAERVRSMGLTPPAG